MIEILDVWMSWLSLGVFVLGVGMIILGDQFGMASVLGGGIALMGGAGMISGLESILTRKAAFVPWSLSGRNLGRFATLSAVLWGLLFLVFGGMVLLTGGAVVFLPGGVQAALNRAFETRLGWVAFGLLLGSLSFTLGLMRLSSVGDLGDISPGRRLQMLTWRGGGVVMLVAGLGLAGISLLVGVAPTVATNLASRLAVLFLSLIP
jgi:hypothetical protein